MFSRFFIDRPIFAAVVSIVIALAGVLALANLPVAQYPRISPPSVSVSISYPGASAQVVADTVAAPIEQQVNGVPGMLYMSSNSGNDGSYSLSVTFEIGTDLNAAMVQVQNRVQLALPQLPTAVRQQGITVRKRTPDILLVVNFKSDGRYDNVYLSNYATIAVRDELLREEGISDVTVFGQRDYAMRVWLDPPKLAARGVTAADVTAAVRSQNTEVAVGRIGQPPGGRARAFQFPLDARGSLTEKEEFEDIVVKAATGGAPPAFAASSGGGGGGGGGTPGATGTSLANGAATSLAAPAAPSGPASIRSLSGGTTSSTGSSGGPLYVGPASGSSAPPSTTAASAGAATMPGTGTGGTQTAIASTTAATTGGAVGPVSLFGGSLDGGPDPASAAVRLRDVARVELGAATYDSGATFDGKPSVGLALRLLPDANALAAGDRIRDRMAELKERFPEGVDYEIAYDTTPFIRESIRDVVVTLFEAVGLVALVVLLFLQNWRAALIPMLAVPVAILGTFAVMLALGYSVNNISLFGLVLAIGIVVDDAIVVVENVERWLDRGLSPRDAAYKAMGEVTGPVVAIALVLCAVFVPCAFVGGIPGQFYRQFAVTVAASTVVSAINSLTLSPALCALLIKPHPPGGGRRDPLPRVAFPVLLAVGACAFLVPLVLPHATGWAARWPQAPKWWREWGGMILACAAVALPVAAAGWLLARPLNWLLGQFFRLFNWLFEVGTKAYAWAVGWLIRGGLAVVLLYAGLLVLTYLTFQKATIGFVPDQDQGRLIVSIQLPDSASLNRTQAVMQQVDAIALRTPGVAHTTSTAGMSLLAGANSSNFGSIFVVLKPFDERQAPHLKADAIVARLRKEFANITDADVKVFPAAPVPGLSVAGGFKAVVEDRGGLGLAELQKQADALVLKLKDEPSTVGVTTQFRSKTPQLYLDVDRTKVESLGVDLNDVNQTMQVFLGSSYASNLNAFGRHWQVKLQAEGEFRNRTEDVNLLQVRNKRGEMVPLGALVRLREINGPVSVNRYNLYPAAAISGNVPPNVGSGEAIAAVDRTAEATLPRAMRAEWTELFYLQIRTGNTAVYAFGLAVAAVFLALAALYESWALPLAVILVVPLCLLCSVGGVMLSGKSVDIFVQIGLIVLVGLACKNAILIVEFAEVLHKQGKSRFDAAVEASRLRIRPILMTSLAFVLGVVPLMLANGAGAEMRRSLGTAVFWGMIGVTAFGVFLTPVFFDLIQRAAESKLFGQGAVRRALATLAGAAVGGGGGYMVAQLTKAPVLWAAAIGAGIGAAVAVGAPLVWRLIRGERANAGVASGERGSAGSPPPPSKGGRRWFLTRAGDHSSGRCPMIPRFFIDRPIFAAVLSIVVTLAGGVAAVNLPVAQYPEVTPPTVVVTASYPGANALTLQDTVAAPIEEQVSGVEGMMYMSSQCTNDGTYTLTVTFKLGTNPDIAQVLVQNRVSLAQPVIPELVQREGVVVKKQSPSTLMIVNLVSPDGRYPVEYLSNYATIEVRDELGRLPGVAGVGYLGQRDYSMRVWLDPNKLASKNLTAADVVDAIGKQNVQVAAGQIGQQPVPSGQQYQLTINTRGRLVEPEEFADIIVKVGQGGPAGTDAAQAGTAGASGSGDPSAAGGTTTAADSTGSTTGQSTAVVRLRDVVTEAPKTEQDGRPADDGRKVGGVQLGAQQYDQGATLDGRPTVALTVYGLPGSNALDTAAKVKAKMKELKGRFPEGLDYAIAYDTTPFIEQSVREVFATLGIAVALVAVVVMVFLQSWRAALIPLVAVPVAVIGTFAVMLAFGFSINTLTLFGLVLAIGIVVDDAIVVVENVERWLEKGLDPKEAARKAMDEVTGPVVAIALVLSAVFIPAAFIGGLTGQFFRQFAVTIAVSTLLSAFNSLTLSPALAGLLLRPKHDAKAGVGGRIVWAVLSAAVFGLILFLVGVWKPLKPFRPDHPSFVPNVLSYAALLLAAAAGYYHDTLFRWFNAAFEFGTGVYAKAVGYLVRLAVVVLVVYGGLLALTGVLYSRTPNGFIPQQDKGYLILNVQLPDSAAVERTQRLMARIEKAALDTPGVEHTVGITGQSLILNANAPNLGSLYVMLKPFDERTPAGLTSDAVARDLEARCRAAVRGAAVRAFGATPIEGLGTTGGFKLVIEDRGNLGTAELQRVSDQVAADGNATPGLQGLFNSARFDTPWVYLDIDRTKCLALGVSVDEVFNALQYNLGTYYVNNFTEFGRNWQVNVQADPQFRDRVRDVALIQVRSGSGKMVPLGTVLSVRDASGPVLVQRYNLYPAAVITGDVAAGASVGDAVPRMEAVAARNLPRAMAADWTELTYLQNQAGSTAAIAFGLAVVFVFLVLAAQYESWKLPLAVILVVPMCLLFAALGVNAAGQDVTVFTQIGLIVLVGLACKNAILIVEFAKQKHEAGMSVRDAAVEACRLRIRPILMTSFAFILGVVPLVIAEGAGAEMRRSLGVAVFWGMLGVTVFGVFLTPVFFRAVHWIGRDATAKTPEGGKADGHEPEGEPSPNGAPRTREPAATA